MFSRKSTATNKILYKTKNQCIIELRLEAFCCGLTCSKWLCEHSMILTKITLWSHDYMSSWWSEPFYFIYHFD